MAVVIKSIRTWKDDFWDHVDQSTAIWDACWEWKGERDKDGYGVFNRGGKHLRANIVGYQIQNGVIPKGYVVMHQCDNPPCVKGTHLGLGTNAENLADMAEKGRARGGRRTKDGQEPKNRRENRDVS